MRIDQLSMNLIDQLRAWFHPKDRHIYLSDDLWILSQKVAWETAVSKFLMLPGLVGFWPMSSVQRSTGQAYDLSGQDRHLTYNGNPQYSIYNGIVPYIDLDGSDFLSRADETDLDIQGNEAIFAASVRGLTLGGWFWIDTLTTALAISKLGAGGNISFQLIMNTGTGRFTFQVSGDGATVTAVSQARGPTTGKWYFLVGRFTPAQELAISTAGADFEYTKVVNTTSIPVSIFSGNGALNIGSQGNATTAVTLDGRASLCFLCANALPDNLISMLYEQSRKLFGVGT